MRFRLGMGMGMAIGYYLGAKAGRERFEQINRTLHRIADSDPVEAATERARTILHLGHDDAEAASDGRLRVS